MKKSGGVGNGMENFGCEKLVVGLVILIGYFGCFDRTYFLCWEGVLDVDCMCVYF